jgi:hypothetical protein
LTFGYATIHLAHLPLLFETLKMDLRMKLIDTALMERRKLFPVAVGSLVSIETQSKEKKRIG